MLGIGFIGLFRVSGWGVIGHFLGFGFVMQARETTRPPSRAKGASRIIGP